jgi:aspartate racemase
MLPTLPAGGVGSTWKTVRPVPADGGFVPYHVGVKTIGLIGGMSWESTRVYYELLNRGVQRRLGGLHSARLIIASVDFAQIAAFQQRGLWADAAQLLALEAARLQAAGADVLALATNTMHKVAPDMTRAIRIPFLHIAVPLAARLEADGRRRPLLLATRFTMEEPFIRERLEAVGMQPILPDEPSRALMHAIIFEELCKGVIKEDSRQRVRAMVADSLHHGADAVILGCTEICLLIKPTDVALPTYDTTALHVEALLDFALDG